MQVSLSMPEYTIYHFPNKLHTKINTNKKLSYRRGTARCFVLVEILPIASLFSEWQLSAILDFWNQFCIVWEVKTPILHQHTKFRKDWSNCCGNGDAENAGLVNAGPWKTRGWKTQDWKTWDQIAGVEKTGLENTGPKHTGGIHVTGKRRTKFPGWKTHDHRLLNAKWISIPLKGTLYDMYIIL